MLSGLNDLTRYLLTLGLVVCTYTYTYSFQKPNPIVFVENRGQWDSEIRFAADVPEGKFILKESGFQFVFTDMDPDEKELVSGSHSHSLRSKQKSVLNVEFAGRNKNIELLSENPRAEKYNYYLSSDRSKWAEDCRAFEIISYKNVYDGIDLTVYQKNGSVKYDWIVDENGDPDQIMAKYTGGAHMFLEDGCSFVNVGSSTIMEDRPVAFQINDSGERVPVDCKYAMHDRELGFELGANYNKDKKLTIDPELIFSTFSGSISDNFGYTACFDNAGNLYSGGIVFGSQFPSTTGASFRGGITDMAILKYDSSGKDLKYATFIGGSSGETPHSLIVNNNNELVIMGTSGSTDYPVSTDAYDKSYNGGRTFTLFEEYTNGTDIVLTKLDASGHLIASTFVGGAGNDGILRMNAIGDYTNQLIYSYGDYQRGDVFVDDDDNVYVASSTDSTTFPIVGTIQSTYSGGNSDAVVFSLDSNLGNLRWSTYLGGSGDDAAYSIKQNEKGQTVVGGGTNSSDFPTSVGALNPAYMGKIDGFVTVLDGENDSIAQSTFIGTSEYDQVYFIDIDEDQSIYAAGQTSGNYPVSAGAYSNPNSSQFIHKIDASLENTEFSTVIGSGVSFPNISLTAFLANECGNIFLSGWGGEVNNNNRPLSSDPSSTFGLPVTDDALFKTTDGSDFYLLVLSADGSELLYATFFGSTNNGGDHVDGGTSRFDKRGIIYQSVCSCGGSQDDFPTTEGAWATVNNGINSDGIERCNNAAFKFDLATLKARYETSNIDGDQIGIKQGCIPFSVLFTNTSIGGEEFFWDLSDDRTSTDAVGVSHEFIKPGDYEVTLRARDTNTCKEEDIYSTTITAVEEQVTISGPVQICSGSTTQLTATGGISYEWEPQLGLDNANSATPIASPSGTIEYNVEVITPGGCLESAAVTVTVIPQIVEDFEILSAPLRCSGQISFEFINHTSYSGEMSWNFGDGEISSETRPVHSYTNPGVYTVELVIDETCVVQKSIEVTSEELLIPNVFTPNNDGVNDFLVIQSPFEIELSIVDRNGTKVFKDSNYQSDWDGGIFAAGVYYYQVRFPNGQICKGWIQILR